MHEFSLAQGLMGQLQQLAEQHKAKRILRVRVTIGKLSGIVTDSFAFGYEVLSGEFTLTKNSVLEITETEPIRRCLDCGLTLASPAESCPQCGSLKIASEGGDDLMLTQVEME